ncbi:TBC1 domain family member 1 isoform X1 [Hemiscyllium ocellatum]|uniref:TBC1 domain family member 1 isoform X1 n=1 Tax=Hemiscyllium ocellatum TaxID=170820 RepID=UPI0029664016|nr:TBC1 domain family member 1 isoform X1 [Hemiscyllium ocellatum]XP_060680973.1 TBC1 domain family member 1 isoform X1 [Hemiscyllium ocellatum]
MERDKRLASTSLGQGGKGQRFSLQLVGSLPVHQLTTMPMLPWVVAEVRRRSARGTGSRRVRLQVSQGWLRCVAASGGSPVFQQRAQHIHKLLHNSSEPNYFAYVSRSQAGPEPQHSLCFVFRASDHTLVPEIINTIRQAGKIVRQEETQIRAHDDDSFAQKYEVLFVGKVTVAHKKAPPALIDECIEKFDHVRKHNTEGSKEGVEQERTERPRAENSRFFPSRLPTPLVQKRNKSAPKLAIQDERSVTQTQSSLEKSGSLDLNSSSNCDGAQSGGLLEARKRAVSAPNIVQPTNMKANRTMLFTIGQSEVYLISPDTKKVTIEKNFKEISFCSQGIKYVDHFGFICRESPDSGSCHFVCYVFQCTNEALVDEIMLTLKQAFTAAAVHQNMKIQAQLCEGCPMTCLHRLCEKIEGLPPSKAKVEIQKHLSTFNNKDQGSIFEGVQKMKPKNELEENELVLSMLRQLYEGKQKLHIHTGDAKQTSQSCSQPSNMNGQQSLSGRFRLDHLKTKAKKSLAESLENILSMGGSRHKSQTITESTVSEKTALSLSSSNLSKSTYLDESDDQACPISPVKSHGSTGDLLQDLDNRTESAEPVFRRRAHTFSYMPSSVEQPKQMLDETPIFPKPKLMRYHSVSTDTPHKQNDYESSPSPCRGSNGHGNLMRSRRQSWRQQIFLRVASPQKGCESPCRHEDHSDAGEATTRTSLAATCNDSYLGAVAEERKRTSRELRDLWRKAILQQILLLRMEKENQKLQASESDLQNKRLKLDYEEITLCLKEVTLVWEKMLNVPTRPTVKFDMETIHVAMGQGVPRQHRGEIWKLLAEQHQLRYRLPIKQQPKDTPYEELLKQLTSHQHAILIDLGRTFPTHPYFATPLGAGQLSLYNLLKAYSLLDQEVGYCQGLSFVAGILLLHMSEEDAFHMLKFLMYDMGLRKQYRPDMIILQIQMYQLSRLLHDYHRDLYCHFEENEISPSLYAAPWFLTVFASQFPLGFVARVFDMIFLQGSEVIFKVALSLLGSHKPLILQHESLESIVDFIKCTLPNLGLVQMEKTINQVFEMDLSKQLQAYEVEYHVLQDELIDSSAAMSDNERLEKLEKNNNCLRKQNSDLVEELEVAHSKIESLEATVKTLLSNEGRLKQVICTLELERAALLAAVEEFQKQVPSTEPADNRTLSEAQEND